MRELERTRGVASRFVICVDLTVTTAIALPSWG
jgi:hypothetical protein